MINKGMMTSNTPEWATPQNFFDELNKEFEFTFDVCATKENAKCPNYYTKEQDGLSQCWDYETIWCNPPYGREIGKWVKKASEAVGGVVVMLLPARTDTRYFHQYIYKEPNVEIRFIKGRLKFGDGKNSAPFPSMVVVFRGYN
jgi:site-specific DNA-methyltransferase (adenine-specific)